MPTPLDPSRGTTNLQVRPVWRVSEDHQMRDRFFLIGLILISALISALVLWLVWTGIAYLMAML